MAISKEPGWNLWLSTPARGERVSPSPSEASSALRVIADRAQPRCKQPRSIVLLSGQHDVPGRHTGLLGATILACDEPLVDRHALAHSALLGDPRGGRGQELGRATLPEDVRARSCSPCRASCAKCLLVRPLRRCSVGDAIEPDGCARPTGRACAALAETRRAVCWACSSFWSAKPLFVQNDEHSTLHLGARSLPPASRSSIVVRLRTARCFATLTACSSAPRSCSGAARSGSAESRPMSHSAVA